MDEITDYLRVMESGCRAATPDGRATAGVGGEPASSSPERDVAAAAQPAPTALGADREPAGLVDLLLDRLGDETVRRAIARLIVPR